MTTPKHSTATRKGRYYTHPVTGEQLVSVTNALGALGKPALVGWAAKTVAEAAVRDLPSLAARLRTTPTSELTGELKGHVNMARDTAANLGSEIHHYAEQHVKAGLPLAEMPERVRPYVAAFIHWIRAVGGLDVIHASEMTVASPRHGWAGTLDLIVDLPLYPRSSAGGPVKRNDGETCRWVVDIKTSATRARDSVYLEYGLQLAALASADECWIETAEGTTVQPLRPRPIGGAILNLRATPKPEDGATFVPLDIAQPQVEAFLAAVKITRLMHSWDDGDEQRGKDWRAAHRALGLKVPRSSRDATTPTEAAA